MLTKIKDEKMRSFFLCEWVNFFFNLRKYKQQFFLIVNFKNHISLIHSSVYSSMKSPHEKNSKMLLKPKNQQWESKFTHNFTSPPNIYYSITQNNIFSQSYCKFNRLHLYVCGWYYNALLIRRRRKEGRRWKLVVLGNW